MATAQRQQEIKLIPGVRDTESLEELKFGDGTTMSLRDLFGKRFEGSVIQREFRLIHKPVQNFVRRDFIYLSRCFYVSSVLSENRSIDHAKLDGMESKLAAMFEAVQKLVRSRLNEVTKLLVSRGAENEGVNTPRPMQYIVPIIHPRAYAFIELLRDVDELHSKREHAWLLSHIDHTQRNENFREVMRAVRRIGQVTRENRIGMWKMLQRAADEATGVAGDELRMLATEQSQTLSAERQLDPDTAGSVSAEAALPATADQSLALPAEAGARTTQLEAAPEAV
jgi:hypothetical protein